MREHPIRVSSLSPRFYMSIFGPIHLQHWYPNYQIWTYKYSGCYIQCQYSDRSICSIGSQISKFRNIYPYSEKHPEYISIFRGLQADLMGGSGGADAPPGIKLSFVFWQPRDSTFISNAKWKTFEIKLQTYVFTICRWGSWKTTTEENVQTQQKALR